MMRHVLATSVVLAAAVLTGCSSDDKPSDGTGAASADTSVTVAPTDSASAPAPETPTPAETGSPVDTVRTVLAAYAESDADTACSMQTERYTQRAIELSIRDSGLKSDATCREMVALASGLYKSFGVDPAAAEYNLVDESGDKARVSVDYGGDLGGVTLVLLRSGDGWLLDEEIQDQ